MAANSPETGAEPEEKNAPETAADYRREKDLVYGQCSDNRTAAAQNMKQPIAQSVFTVENLAAEQATMKGALSAE